ncbi:MAG: HAMP domain-containing protein [Chromatiaceae bacterium]|nr:HAMP domain-containing protein [Chromatiaceae bacterium]
MRLKIAGKIATAFLAMGVVLALCGGAGFWVQSRLSSTLDRITRQVMENMEAANLGLSSVDNQLIAVDRLLAGDESQQQILAQARETTALALERIRQSQMLAKQLLGILVDKLAVFDRAQHQLLSADQSYRLTHARFIDQTDRLQDFFIELEKLASQQLLTLQMQGTDSEERTEDLELESRDAINYITEARLSLLSRLYELSRYLADPNVEEVLNELNLSKEDLAFNVESLAGISFLSEKVKSTNISYRQTLTDLFNEHLALLEQTRHSYTARMLEFQRYRESAGSIKSLGVEIETEIRQQAEVIIEEANDSARAGAITIATTIVIGLIMGILVYSVSVKNIALPIRRVCKQLEVLSSGDLSVTVDDKGSDELADLARNFNGFAEKIRAVILQVQESIARLAQNTSHVASVASRTEQQVEQQQQEMATMVVAINELSQSIRDVTGSTAEAHDKTRDTVIAAANGVQMMESSKHISQHVTAAVEHATSVMNTLGEHAHQIDNILNVIGGISEQTNLLALNAAIEAARAGEHGRGFAVVASEVRQLANRVQEATGEIRGTIERLRAEADSGILAMEESKRQADINLQHAIETSNALLAIRQLAESIDQLNTRIASTTEQQNTSAEGIRRNAISTQQAADGTAKQVAILTHAAEDLGRLSQELDKLAAYFSV